MENDQRIILVTELFYPEESATAHILTKIATHLAADHPVLVLSGPESYENNASRLATHDILNIRIHRSWAPNLSKNKLISRVLRFIILSLGLGWNTLRKANKNDTVLAVTNPALLVVALALLRKIIKFRLVLLVHDIFPENAAATGMISTSHISYTIFKRVFDWAYGTADHIIAIGRDMAEVIASKTKHSNAVVTIIENWADTLGVVPHLRENSLLPTWNLEKNIVVQYAGNLGRAQGILEFIDFISQMAPSAAHFVFCGSGALRGQLSEKTKQLQYVTLQGAFSRADQNLTLNSCDIALVILKPEMYGLGVPSKTYNIMAAGKPVLFLGPRNSEIYRLVQEHRIGWAFDWSEKIALQNFIQSLSLDHLPHYQAMGQKARMIAQEHYSELAQLVKFKTTLFPQSNPLLK